MTDTLFPPNRSADGGRLLVLTNRSNVIDVLSSGLLRPRAALEKYYTDLSELWDGFVPVLTSPLSDEVVAYVTDRPTQFPVAIEVDPDAVAETTRRGVGKLVVATLDSILCVHLASEDDLAELRARRFDNVDWERVPFAVSPALFEGGATSVEEVRGAFPAGHDVQLDFRLQDRLGGARLLATQAVPDVSGALEVLARLVFGKPRRPGRNRSHLTDWLTIDESLQSYAPSKSAAYDERVFRAAAARCIGMSRTDSWDGVAFVDGITEVLRADTAMDEGLPRWEEAAGRIRDITLANRVFEGFASTDYTTEGAVLLAALRGAPEDVLAWRDEGIGANGWVLTVAALLIGLVHGRTAIRMELRPSPLDRALASRERGQLVGEPWNPRSKVVSNGPVDVLLIDGAEVATVVRSAPPIDQLVDQIDPMDPGTEQELLTLAQDLGWDEFIRTTVAFAGPFSHDLEDGTSRITFRSRSQIQNVVDAKELLAHARSQDDERVRAALERLARRGAEGPA